MMLIRLLVVVSLLIATTLVKAKNITLDLPPITPTNAAQVTELAILMFDAPYPNNIVNDVAFSPNGETFALGVDNRTMEMRHVDTQSFSDGYEIVPLGQIGMSVTFSPDGSILAVGENSGSVRLWDTETVTQIGLLEGGAGAMFDVAFTPDGATLAAVDGAYVWIWDVATGESLARLDGAEDFVTGLAISPDGQNLAAASWDGIVRVWDFASGDERYRLNHDQGAYSLAYSQDGSLLATGGGGEIFLWDTGSGTQRNTITLDPRADGYPVLVWDLDFNQDGTVLAAATDENGSSSILLWDVAAGREITELSGHQSAILSLDFNTGGTLLASTSSDGTVRLWGVSITCVITAPSNANIRSGPGTNFDVVGSLVAGESAEADGQTEGTDGMTWYRLSDGGWVRSDVVNAPEACAGVQTVTP